MKKLIAAGMLGLLLAACGGTAAYPEESSADSTGFKVPTYGTPIAGSNASWSVCDKGNRIYYQLTKMVDAVPDSSCR